MQLVMLMEKTVMMGFECLLMAYLPGVVHLSHCTYLDDWLMLMQFPHVSHL